MSNKLWIFGDSFSAMPKGEFNFPLWHELVASGLGFTGYENRAETGVSNDWIFHEYTTYLNEMEPGDYVIIQPTQKYRQWFFEDPTLSNYYLKDLDQHVSKEQFNAVKQYITHLQRDIIDELRYAQFILSLERLSEMAKHVRILVLPGFFGVAGVQGSLISICDGEFDNEDHVVRWIKAHDGKDPRPNHMSETNHKVLADKILNFFSTGQPIDLNNGFQKAIINEYK